MKSLMPNAWTFALSAACPKNIGTSLGIRHYMMLFVLLLYYFILLFFLVFTMYSKQKLLLYGVPIEVIPQYKRCNSNLMYLTYT